MTTMNEALVRAATDELRRQVKGLEEIALGHVHIPRRVDLDVEDIVDAVLGELNSGWGALGECEIQ